jgi:hypothetical protein
VKWLRDPLKWIGCYQIGAALFATEVLQRQFSAFLAGGPVGWLAFVLITGFFTLNAVAGVLLLRGAPRAKAFTVVAQLPQVLWADMPGLLYYVTCGVSLALNWQHDWFGFTTSAGSQVSLFVRHVPQSGSAGFAVNFVPLAVLYILYRWRNQIGSSRAA